MTQKAFNFAAINVKVYHMVQSCPEKQVIHHAQEIIPFQSDFDHPDNGKHLASETQH